MSISPDISTASAPERIVLFGSEGGFSRPLLNHLLEAGVSVEAVVVPGFTVRDASVEAFPVAIQQPQNTTSLVGLAADHDIPVLRIQHMQSQRLADSMARYPADILLVACFPFRIPATLRQLMRIACWNLHPSLLPRYRGPAPIFWQIRNCERHTGITLHEVSDQLDAGNVVAQKPAPLPQETSDENLSKWVAEYGVDLILEALNNLRRGCRITYPQDETLASYYPLPRTLIAHPDRNTQQWPVRSMLSTDH
jgi:methionyl-tRNA formyltransferase